jgi:DNA repair protein RadD
VKLRERQVQFVERCVSALKERGNTLGVAPTGAGKTVMLSAVARDMGGRSLIVQHRDELVAQNERTFRAVAPDAITGIVNASEKDWNGEAVFGMIQTIIRNLGHMPAFDNIIIDEAHHTAADSYLRTVDHAKKLNDKTRVFGVTATPTRGDSRALLTVFDNCADQIFLGELIKAGHLVRPRTFVVDMGVGANLMAVKKTAADYDMEQVAKIMDRSVINDRVVEEWRKVASTRQTVVFCSTVAHAQHVAESFRAGGIAAATVWGEMPTGDRRETLAAYDSGEIQVVTNAMVLTEGWDHQPTSCVVLLRPSSFKSTMIQMIGRGLRKVDPERYPGVVKDDCIVLDFGTSVVMHGGLEQDVNLEGSGTKDCPECKGVVPEPCNECPLCGHVFKEPEPQEEPEQREKKERRELVEFAMSEVDFFTDSPLRWETMFGGIAKVASALDAWAVVIKWHGRWAAIGGAQGRGVKLLATSEDHVFALASADDFLRAEGDTDVANKAKSWMHQPPSDKQCQHLGVTRDQAVGMGITRYRATCLLTWKWNERAIQAKASLVTRTAVAA